MREKEIDTDGSETIASGGPYCEGKGDRYRW